MFKEGSILVEKETGDRYRVVTKNYTISLHYLILIKCSDDDDNLWIPCYYDIVEAIDKFYTKDEMRRKKLGRILRWLRLGTYCKIKLERILDGV